MNTRNNITLSIGLLTAIGAWTIASAAQAQSMADVLRNVLGTSNNSSSNQTYNNPSIHQTQTMSNLNTKRIQLDDQVAQSLSIGQISSQQANDFRAQLSANANLQNTYGNDGNLTFAEAQALLNTLTNIEASVQSTINLSTTYPTYPTNGNNGYFGNGHRSNSGNWNRNFSNNYDNINLMQTEILNRLQQAQANRQLTPSAYNNLRTEYDRIASREVQVRNSGNQLSLQERNSLLSRLNKLDTSLRTQMNERPISGRWAGPRSYDNY